MKTSLKREPQSNTSWQSTTANHAFTWEYSTYNNQMRDVPIKASPPRPPIVLTIVTWSAESELNEKFNLYCTVHLCPQFRKFGIKQSAEQPSAVMVMILVILSACSALLCYALIFFVLMNNYLCLIVLDWQKSNENEYCNKFVCSSLCSIGMVMYAKCMEINV